MNDAARKRRLITAWADPEISTEDLFARGFSSAEMAECRMEHGPKERGTADPQWGQVRRKKVAR